MSYAKVYSAQSALLDASLVTVEIDISRGLNHFAIVGLPDKAVEEARDRISAAIKNSGFTSPKQKNHKIVISLAPADLKKEGSVFDLAMALAYLAASKEARIPFEGKIFLGELSLYGEVSPIRGALSIVKSARALGFKEVYLPRANAKEGALIDGITVYGVGTLKELLAHFAEGERTQKIQKTPRTCVVPKAPKNAVSFEDVRGQHTAKRGLEIAAAGRHNIALYGPPGTGKTMLARAFTGILPPLSFEETLEVTGIHSVAGAQDAGLATHPPFRAPHHTSSYIALVGGGAHPRPGEITLAHRGVLFLDEFPEFDRRVIEALRHPLEDRVVQVSRAKGTAHFPANFILIAALNPCPCGNRGGPKPCVCPPSALVRYERKLSGPIMDRIDMWIEVPHLEVAELGRERGKGGETEAASQRVSGARDLQRARQKKTNSELSVRELDRVVPLSKEARDILDRAAKTLHLSPRAYHRTIKLARTIADLEGSEGVTESHLLEALQYRPKPQTA